MRVNRSEARTDHIHIRVRPSIKQMAVAMAKAEERSLSIFISRLIEAEAKRTGNASKKRWRSVRFGSKAATRSAKSHVRFTPKSG
jgi:hypothetical protein